MPKAFPEEFRRDVVAVARKRIRRRSDSKARRGPFVGCGFVRRRRWIF